MGNIVRRIEHPFAVVGPSGLKFFIKYGTISLQMSYSFAVHKHIIHTERSRIKFSLSYFFAKHESLAKHGYPLLRFLHHTLFALSGVHIALTVAAYLPNVGSIEIVGRPIERFVQCNCLPALLVVFGNYKVVKISCFVDNAVVIYSQSYLSFIDPATFIGVRIYEYIIYIGVYARTVDTYFYMMFTVHQVCLGQL